MRSQLVLTFAVLALGFAGPARPQAAPTSGDSVADAARNARAQKSNSTGNPKVITNDDFAPPPSAPAPGPSANSQASSGTQSEVSASTSGDCHNPDAERLKAQLEAAQEQLDQLRRNLSRDPAVISGGDLDTKNFKPGSSGVAMGSPPLSQSVPQSPARIDEVSLQDKVASLKEAARLACEPPGEAAIQVKINAAEDQLKLLQREFALDQNAYLSNTNYREDTAGKAKLDGEKEQIDSLQSEIDRLKEELQESKDKQGSD